MAQGLAPVAQGHELYPCVLRRGTPLTVAALLQGIHQARDRVFFATYTPGQRAHGLGGFLEQGMEHGPVGGQQVGDAATGKFVADILVGLLPDTGKQVDDVIRGGGRHGASVRGFWHF